MPGRPLFFLPLTDPPLMPRRGPFRASFRAMTAEQSEIFRADVRTLPSNMRALFIADATFAVREQEMLARLWVALADEGWRVVQAVPKVVIERLTPAAGSPVFARVLPYGDPVRLVGGLTLPFTAGIRAQSLINSIEELDELGDDEAPADLIHATGGAAWPIALEIGRRLGVPVALEIWRHGQIERAKALTKASGDIALLAPDPATERALMAAGIPFPVRVVPWGVHPHPTPHHSSPHNPQDAERRAGKPISAMVIGSGNDSAAFAAALTGLASVISRITAAGADALVFIDADAARKARVWPLLNKLGLLPRTSLIENLEARRDLLVEGDVLIVPEARGEHRTALLEAMASGMLVAAARDPMVSVLRDGETAALIDRADPGLWAATIESLLTRDHGVDRLARSAQAAVERDHTVSAQVRALLDTYEWLTGAGRVKWQAAASTTAAR